MKKSNLKKKQFTFQKTHKFKINTKINWKQIKTKINWKQIKDKITHSKINS